MIVHEVEYRLSSAPDPDDPADTDDEANRWRRWPHRVPADEGDMVLVGLDRGTYDVRLRAVDDRTEAASDWREYRGIVVTPAPGTPPALAGLQMIDDNCLTWQAPDVLYDLRGVAVRHVPGTIAEWGTAEPVTVDLVPHPPLSLCGVPGGTRTILARQVDWDGNEGPVSRITVTRDSGEQEIVVRERDEAALSFPGTVDGAPTPASQLVAAAADDRMFVSDIEPMFSVDPYSPLFPNGDDEPLVGRPWAVHAPWLDRADSADLFASHWQWIEYLWAFTVEPGEDGHTLSIDITTNCGRGDMPAVGYRIEYRRPDPYPWMGEGLNDPLLPVSGEMFPSESIRPWAPWPGAVVALTGEYEFRLTIPGSLDRNAVTGLVTRLTRATRTEHTTELSIPANGGTRATPSEPFVGVVQVTVDRVHSEEPVIVVVTDRDRNRGPRLRAYDVTGEPVAVTVDVSVRG